MTPVESSENLSRGLAVLSRLSGLLVSDRGAGELCQQTLDLSTEALGIRHGALFACDRDGQLQELFAVAGWEPGQMQQNLHSMGIPPQLLPVPIVAGANRSLAVSHRFPPREVLQKLQVQDGISAFIAMADGTCLCLILFTGDEQGFGDLDLELLNLIANMLASAMKYSDLMGGETQSVRSAIQAKQQWEATVDVLPQVVCLLDENMRIIRANRAVETWGLGNVDTMPGRSLQELLANVDDGNRRQLDGFVARASVALTAQSHYREKLEEAEHRRDLFLSLRLLAEDNDGDAVAAWAAFVMEDITERCLAETMLKRYNQDLEHKVRKRTDELSEANRNLKQQITAYEEARGALEKSRQDLQILSSQLLDAQETERKRIACELHDGVGQTLSAIKFRIEHLMNTCERQPVAKSKSALEDSVERLRDAVEEIRRISMNLRPSILDDLGIVATLSWFAREFQKSYHTLQMDLRMEVEDHQVPEPIRIVIFRIIQEACNNIVKHAGARRIVIRLSCDSNGTCLSVLDDGRGFDVEEAMGEGPERRGTGLSSMLERAHLSSGLCQFRSRAGQGTEVLVCWGSTIAADSGQSGELVFDGVGDKSRG